MKKFNFTLAALILTSALVFTGCEEVSKTVREDNSAQQTNSQLESNGSNVFLAAGVPSASEAIPESEAPTSSISDISLMPEIEESFTSESNVSSVPSVDLPTASVPDTSPVSATTHGNCPDCDGTGHHNNTVCGTCNGSGFYNGQSTAPHGNCPDCDGTGHHNNTVCGTCNGSGWYNAQSHHGDEHHQNRGYH